MMKQSLWALAAAACFSFMAVFVKLCSGHFGSLELVFYRSLIGIVTISMFVRSQGLSLRTHQTRSLRHYFRRSVVLHHRRNAAWHQHDLDLHHPAIYGG